MRCPWLSCVHRKEPDLELEGLLKRHSTTVKFFQGSMMNAVDLARVKVVIEKKNRNKLIEIKFLKQIRTVTKISTTYMPASRPPPSLSLSLSSSNSLFSRSLYHSFPISLTTIITYITSSILFLFRFFWVTIYWIVFRIFLLSNSFFILLLLLR